MNHKRVQAKLEYELLRKSLAAKIYSAIVPTEALQNISHATLQKLCQI